MFHNHQRKNQYRAELDKMREASTKLARELKVKGLMNVQFAVREDLIYVLEANPRASRTVPFIAKAVGVRVLKFSLGFGPPVGLGRFRLHWTRGHTDVTFTVGRSDLTRALSLAERLAEELGASGVESNDSIAKVSVVGLGMKDHAGVAATMFQALSDEGVNIEMINTSEIKISVVIEEKYTELACRTLHDAFELDKIVAQEEVL